MNTSDAGEAPVERPVRPCAWKCSTCANTSDCEGATRGDNWCNSCGACETMRPLYDQAALNAAAAAERERIALKLRGMDCAHVCGIGEELAALVRRA